MEKKVKEFLEELAEDESEAVSRIFVPAQRPGKACFYDYFTLTGGRVEPGLIVCTLKDRAGNLAKGAIANIVDIVTGCVAYIQGLRMNVSVDISISYMSTAKLDDELEITVNYWLTCIVEEQVCSFVIVLPKSKEKEK